MMRKPEWIPAIKDALCYKAMCFAMDKHKNQRRKYTNEPYWKHLAEVAALVSTVHSDPSVIAAAWLHDTLEDTDTTEEELENEFGFVVKDYVVALSDLETGNRAERKRLSRERLAKTCEEVQNIKICDMISNTSSIAIHDPRFAKIYLKEKALLLQALDKTDNRLLKIAYNMIDNKKEG